MELECKLLKSTPNSPHSAPQWRAISVIHVGSSKSVRSLGSCQHMRKVRNSIEVNKLGVQIH